MPLRENDKRPLYTEWLFLKDRRLSEAELTNAYKRTPNANIAIITGKLSNLTVVDVDILKSGSLEEIQTSREEAERLLADLPQTFTVRTPGGGYHLYYGYDAAVPNMSNKRIHPQIDLRSEGGYVVAPPSVIDGKKYEVVNVIPVTPFPDRLKRLLKRHAMDPMVRREMWVTIAKGSGEGSRNGNLTQLLGRLLYAFSRSMTKTQRDLDIAFVYEIAKAWNAVNNTPPLSHEEFDRTFNSIVNTHYGRT